MRDMWGSFAGETQKRVSFKREDVRQAGSRPTNNHARCEAPWQTVAQKEKDPPALDRGSFSIVWSGTDTFSAALRITGELSDAVMQPIHRRKGVCPLHAAKAPRGQAGEGLQTTA